MSPRRLASSLVAASFPVAMMASCRAQVLSLGTTSSTALPEIAPGTTLAELTGTQTTDLCNWLIAEFPDPNKSVPPRDSPNCGSGLSGYVGGRTLGCGDHAHPFSWVLLDTSDCIANLGHSACRSTIDSLEQCISSFRQAFDAGNYCSAAPGCAAYWSDPACTETVLQATPFAVGMQADLCGACLPVEGGVSCVSATSSMDGGSE